MKRTDLAYIAGIIDGEGSISLVYARQKPSRSSLNVRVQVANTNEWLVQWLRMAVGGWITKTNRSQVQDKIWKVGYQWCITGIRAKDFLELVYPYLRLKKPQAEIAMGLAKMRGKNHHRLTETEKIFAEAQRILIGKMNKKGPIPREE